MTTIQHRPGHSLPPCLVNQAFGTGPWTSAAGESRRPVGPSVLSANDSSYALKREGKIICHPQNPIGIRARPSTRNIRTDQTSSSTPHTVNNITVTGPDGRRYLLSDVPADMTVGRFADEFIRRAYSDPAVPHLCPRRAAVYLNDSASRLDRNATLYQVGISVDSKLLIVPSEVTAGSGEFRRPPSIPGSNIIFASRLTLQGPLISRELDFINGRSTAFLDIFSSAPDKMATAMPLKYARAFRTALENPGTPYPLESIGGHTVISVERVNLAIYGPRYNNDSPRIAFLIRIDLEKIDLESQVMVRHISDRWIPEYGGLILGKKVSEVMIKPGDLVQIGLSSLPFLVRFEDDMSANQLPQENEWESYRASFRDFCDNVFAIQGANETIEFIQDVSFGYLYDFLTHIPNLEAMLLILKLLGSAIGADDEKREPALQIIYHFYYSHPYLYRPQIDEVLQSLANKFAAIGDLRHALRKVHPIIEITCQENDSKLAQSSGFSVHTSGILNRSPDGCYYSDRSESIDSFLKRLAPFNLEEFYLIDLSNPKRFCAVPVGVAKENTMVNNSLLVCYKRNRDGTYTRFFVYDPF